MGMADDMAEAKAVASLVLLGGAIVIGGGFLAYEAIFGPSKAQLEQMQAQKEQILATEFNAHSLKVQIDGETYGLVTQPDGRCVLVSAHEPVTIDAKGNFATFKPEAELTTRICPK